MTLAEALRRYGTEVMQFSGSRSAKYHLAKIVETLGPETLVSDVSVRMLSDYVAARRHDVSRYGRPYSPRTINMELFHFRRLMIRAERVWGLPVSATAWPWLPPDASAERHRILTDEEEERLLAAAADHLRPAIEFSLLTGLRLNNTLRLDWSQIDMSVGSISVGIKGGRHLVLPIAPGLRKVLEGLGPKSSGRVFTYRGRPLTTWYCSWRTALRRSGLEGMHWHDLRHTFADRLLKRGARLTDVRDLLGHASIKSTMSYVQVSDRQVEAALRILE